MFGTITIGLVVCVLLLWIRWRKNKLSIFKKLGIPGPPPSFFIGNMWDIYNLGPLEAHCQWQKKYGRVMGYYFGLRPVLLISDPQMLKTIQIKEFQNYSGRPPLFHIRFDKEDAIHNHLMNLKGNRWKTVRSFLTPLFSSSKLKMISSIVTGSISDLVDMIEVNKGKEFDIHALYQQLTLDVICKTALGIQTNVLKDASDPMLRMVKIAFSPPIKSILFIIGLSFPELNYFIHQLFLLKVSKMNKGKPPMRALSEACGNIIEQRQNDSSKKRLDLLQLMIDTRMSDKELNSIDLTAGKEDNKSEEYTESTTKVESKVQTKSMSVDEMKANAVLFLLAGYETTSTALGFFTHVLLKYPHLQDEIRKEILELAKKEGELNFSSINKLPILEKAFSETLRYYPPVYLFINRETVNTVQCGEMTIPKNMTVQVPVYLMHHDPEFWEDPELFDIERFSPERRKDIDPIVYQPFGAGPRNCIGLRFAEMEAKMTIAYVLQRYRLLPSNKTKQDIETKMGLFIMSPKDGVTVKVEPI